MSHIILVFWKAIDHTLEDEFVDIDVVSMGT